MSEPFLAEIRMFGFNFAPRGWAQCDGQLLPINQNQSLFSLLGTTYGGDGRTTFQLPDLRGRAAMHEEQGNNDLGTKGGEERVLLAPDQIPAHTHQLTATNAVGNSGDPVGRELSRSSSGRRMYTNSSANLVDMHADAVHPGSGGQAHNNMHPYLAINFCIAIQGLFPSRN